MPTLDRTALPPEALAQLPALCRRFGVARLDVFGSAVTGRFDPARSDLDFLVAFDPSSHAGGLRDYFAFCDALQALFGRPVDLLTEGSLENPYLRRRVMAERVPLFAA
ncbi:MAG: nucleotidyltransferase family protein [Acetobacteraceae bacterium]|nr:nucleotidyltransferase family protein [Acetobacteraceae bacterium]